MTSKVSHPNYFGEVYRLFRKSKNFTQKEAAGNDISPNELSNFENGKAMLGADKFFQILQNINVNSFEFQYTYNSYLEARDLLLFDVEVTDAYRHNNISKLKSILKKLTQLSSQNPQKKKYLLDRINVQAVLSILSPDFPMPLADRRYIQNYLLQIDEWGLYDIILLGRCASIFDLKTLYEMVNQMISPTQMSTKIHYIQREMIRTVLNVLSIFIENDQYHLANQLVNYLDENKIHEYHLFEKLTFIYDKATLDYKKGNKNALSTMKQCLEILEFCECFSTANAVADEINQIKSHN
ncbi:Rgg/GadR/MutR family transcriptional regulator [Lactococcus kimchii]|uniref:Rgg/GadR/MutR family transcriptional regulator n=1 Tax=Lactococcus sp. S-13 TaxID=2507158 RepID=UPI001022EEFE|nr:helix-turn-helix domain-containing protein [Lactococcus sp. S-13]RZI49310.1 hypothetical protein EQJ87_07565 [Lactococcus sp. S-13]